ncbi:radical SAM (seleno)protein TrsS [Clostridium sp. JNZ X4-2]
MDNMKVISETESLCPICRKKISAVKVLQDNEVYMEKYCNEHGKFKTILWRGSTPIDRWVRNKERMYIKNPGTAVEKGCPFDCGLCSSHRQRTCTALIEVTGRCNLNCEFCFAGSSSTAASRDPSLEQIKFWYESILKSSGKCNIQLSGGEPTMRDDLPQAVSMGKKLGFEFIQINTNGLRMAEDKQYVKKLKQSGLNSIFLQFDGTRDSIYKRLRGRNLLNVKIKAVENCSSYGIGVVLVPTLVPGINTDNIGEIIKFAVGKLPVVRGVHFQPVSYFGRIPYSPNDEYRITLPEVMDAVENQTSGKIKVSSMKPPGCENSLCSFHGNYILKNKKELISVTNNSNGCCGVEKAEEGAKKSIKFVSRNWSSREKNAHEEKLHLERPDTWQNILYTIRNYSFSISAMAFQDIWNIDLERLKDCCIHVVNPKGKLIPFCIYNMTDTKGDYIYRNAEPF